MRNVLFFVFFLAACGEEDNLTHTLLPPAPHGDRGCPPPVIPEEDDLSTPQGVEGCDVPITLIGTSTPAMGGNKWAAIFGLGPWPSQMTLTQLGVGLRGQDVPAIRCIEIVVGDKDVSNHCDYDLPEEVVVGMDGGQEAVIQPGVTPVKVSFLFQTPLAGGGVWVNISNVGFSWGCNKPPRNWWLEEGATIAPF